MNKKPHGNRTKWLRVLLLLGILICLGSLVGTSATNISAMNYFPRPYYYCSGSSCNGYYPAYWGCDGDAITVSSRYILLPANVGIVELRFSDNCTAFWSRTTLSVGGYYIGSTLDRQSLTPDYGIVSGAPLGIYDSVHTMMSSSQQNCRTCGTASYTQPPALSYSNCGIFMTK